MPISRLRDDHDGHLELTVAQDALAGLNAFIPDHIIGGRDGWNIGYASENALGDTCHFEVSRRILPGIQDDGDPGRDPDPKGLAAVASQDPVAG